MSELRWTITVAYWFWKLSGMTVLESWSYAKQMDREYWYTDDFDPRTAVETEMSYWEA